MRLVLAYDSQYPLSGQSIMRLWCLLDENQQIILQGQDNTPAEIAEATKHYTFTTTVLLMSPDVNVLKVPRPQGSYNKIRQALPYLLEEQLIEDVEKLHFAILDQVDSQNLVVAVINRTLLQNCVTVLTEAKLIPETVLPVWLVLPEADLNQWKILYSSDYFWMRTGEFSGFSLEPEMAEKILSTLYIGPAPDNIEWLVPADTTLNSNWLKECADRNIPTSVSTLPATDNWLTYIAKHLPEELTLNLLHSEFSIKQQIIAQKKSWKIVGMLVASIFSVWFLGMVGQYFYFSLNVYLQNKEIEKTYQQIFPGTDLIGNPRTVVDRELTRIAQGAAGTDFLSLLLRTGEIIQKFPQIHIEQMVYNNKQLDISVTADNFSRLKELDEEFANRGVPLKQENVNSTGGVVQARLIIG